MRQSKPDLSISSILTDKPMRTFTINASELNAGRLSLIEALDIVEASGIDSGDFAHIMTKGTMRQKAALLYAFAWVVARRVEPDLTYAEVCTYSLEITGEPANTEANKRKADAVIGVATLANISPQAAGQMTMDEISSLIEIKKARVARATRKPVRRRRAS